MGFAKQWWILSVHLKWKLMYVVSKGFLLRNIYICIHIQTFRKSLDLFLNVDLRDIYKHSLTIKAGANYQNYLTIILSVSVKFFKVCFQKW